MFAWFDRNNCERMDGIQMIFVAVLPLKLDSEALIKNYPYPIFLNTDSIDLTNVNGKGDMWQVNPTSLY
jgi:hypothetical protein